MDLKNKQKDNRKDIINLCIEVLSDTNITFLDIAFNRVIDLLGSYPKPRQKGDEIEPQPTTLGSYLFVSNARNAVKLGLLKYHTEAQAGIIGIYNLRDALKLIDSEIKEKRT